MQNILDNYCQVKHALSMTMLQNGNGENPYQSPITVANEKRESGEISEFLKTTRGKVLATCVIGGSFIAFIANRNQDPNTTITGSVRYDRYTEGTEDITNEMGIVGNAIETAIVEGKTFNGMPHR